MPCYLSCWCKVFMGKKKSLEEELDGDFLSVDKDSDENIEEDVPSDQSKEELAEILSSQLGEEIPQRDYKYLKIHIEQESEFEYYVIVEHQSHGLMNYMVSKMLKCSGVEFCAYKQTSFDPPKMYVRLNSFRDIKSVLREALTKMKTEWKGMKNAVAAMKL
ncbi:MAG: hypothetical protein DRO88_07525 [Promethearchaeia archaeon]|nr:MAG: hypothetical protein DRO88_07525 [Candidatus Lokiarchaeia archaeon]